ncbi:hypothetical protein H8K32_19790 [Undibacterium jejuense]|uniref:Uncharacterized protein n=1 Tax=Undibacterium jejuense TaxID=1344949 RepID=A0A923KQZ4_9BURK|nr:hypothetical protein [Undibacterium jejuense]MBC3864343.1 hypothetical protein [Undibacterium jejuense]
MTKSISLNAILPNLLGDQLPPIELKIDAYYQGAVNCGIRAAQAFFNEDEAVNLHAHLPACLHHYLNVLRQSCALIESSASVWNQHEQSSRDAFCAGYLGRIQQELRIIRPPLHHYGNAAAMH